MSDDQSAMLQYVLTCRAPFTSGTLRRELGLAQRQAHRAIEWAEREGLIELWEPRGCGGCMSHRWHSLVMRRTEGVALVEDQERRAG